MQQCLYFCKQSLAKKYFDKPALKIFTTCKVDNKDDKLLEKAQNFNKLKGQIKLNRDEILLKNIQNLQMLYPDEPEDIALLAEFYFREGNSCKAKDILKRYKSNKFLGKSYNVSLSLSAQNCGDLETSKAALEEILYFDPYDEFAKTGLKNVKI